jgi:dihydroorotate dehydrogenase electron transfer subunit
MKRIEDLTVTDLYWLNSSTYIIELKAKSKLPQIRAGNFAEIEVANSPKVFLRRPFSVYDVDYKSNTISFFIKAIGEGTRLLGEKRKGENLNLIYPLGNGFTVPSSGRVLVVAGGSGVAPFILYAKEIKKAGIEVDFLFGAKTVEDIVLNDVYSRFGKVMVTTEDGSLGEKGLVTQHSIFSSPGLSYDFIATCGPDPMMKAIAKIARDKNIPCEASLENTMACGFGACLCCITPTTRGNLCVCTDGPVFNVNELKW